MFQFFDAIAAFITTIVNFVITAFELLIELLRSIVRAVTWLFVCVSYLPPFLVAFVLVPISIAIIFQVLNKGS